MANSYIGARSPKGNVGVRGVLDSGELSAYSAGVLSGFTASGASSWTLSIGGVSGTQDVAVAKNPAGESELLAGTAGQDIDFIIGGAPGTPGQSRTDALVIYKDPFATSSVNDGIDTVDYEVVAGTAATTGSQVPPDDTAIRTAIGGSLYFVVVIGYVTVANGAGSITTANYFKNPALISTQVVANATARALITPVEGQKVYQLDDDAEYIYTGSEWLAFDTKWQTYTPDIAFGASNITVNNGTLTARYKRSGKALALQVELIIGSSTSIPTGGTLTITPPFTLASTFVSNNPYVGTMLTINSGVANGIGFVQLNSTTKLHLIYSQYGATANAPSLVTNTAPYTPGTADSYLIMCPNLLLA